MNRPSLFTIFTFKPDDLFSRTHGILNLSNWFGNFFTKGTEARIKCVPDWEYWVNLLGYWFFFFAWYREFLKNKKNKGP